MAQRTAGCLALFLFLVFAPGACDTTQAEGPLCLDDCELCGDNGCPDDRCGFLFILSSDCEEEVAFVEVTVDQCLEPVELTPGSAAIGCKILKDGETRTVTARGETWAWSEDVTCTNKHKGKVIPVAFYCISQSDE